MSRERFKPGGEALGAQGYTRFMAGPHVRTIQDLGSNVLRLDVARILGDEAQPPVDLTPVVLDLYAPPTKNYHARFFHGPDSSRWPKVGSPERKTPSFERSTRTWFIAPVRSAASVNVTTVTPSAEENGAVVQVVAVELGDKVEGLWHMLCETLGYKGTAFKAQRDALKAQLMAMDGTPINDPQNPLTLVKREEPRDVEFSVHQGTNSDLSIFFHKD